jgi:hypothetical protein
MYVPMDVRTRVRLSTLGGLMIVIVAPFLLTVCSSDRQRSPSAPTSSAPPLQASSTSEPPSRRGEDAEHDAGASLDARGRPSASRDAGGEATGTPLPEPPPYRGALPSTCAGLDQAVARSLRERSCRNDDDCATAAPYCGCAQPVARSALPKLRALESAFENRRCYEQGLPRPCATCPPPPVPHCLTSACQ